MQPTVLKRLLQIGISALLVLSSSAYAAKLDLRHALGRISYQTNETIPLTLLRTSEEPLEAGALELTLTGADASVMTFTFPIPAAETTRTEFLNLDARLLRPGAYTVSVSADGVTAETELNISSHLRKSSFRTVNWASGAKGAQHLRQGEDSLGYNLVMQNNHMAPGEKIEAGVDWTSACTMGGGHQMDLRSACDWSDPYVLAHGSTRRVMKDVFGNRTAGNSIGTHFYDEPGLTWWKDPVTDKFTAHMVPAQVRAYKAAFGEDPIRYNEVDPKNPEDLKRWLHWATWKLSFMPAAWRDSAFATNYVRPDYIPFTQSQYGFSAFTDGYYFNVVESLPVVSGHGGYHDWGPGYWHPSWTLDIARARDRAKPCWYMPLWYSSSTDDEARLEQYLSFATGIQGLMTPPPMDPAQFEGTRNGFDGLVEANKLMLRLGPIFNTMEERNEDVAILYSLSTMLQEQATEDMFRYYSHQTKHGLGLHIPYMAGKLNQRTFQYIVEEDVVDGTLAMNHKALILSAIDYLAPEVIAGLNDYIAQGGKVLITQDSEVTLEGAQIIPAVAGTTEEEVKAAEAAEEEYKKIMARTKPISLDNQALSKEIQTMRKTRQPEGYQEKIKELQVKIAANTKAYQAILAEAEPYNIIMQGNSMSSMRGALNVAARFGDALEPMLQSANLPADIESSEPGIAAQIQGQGDVQYTFVLNAVHDFDSADAQKAIKPAVEAKIGLPVVGAAIYDAVRGIPATDLTKNGDAWTGNLRFGKGQMRVYAQTTRPIGSVQVTTPVLHRDLTVETLPISLDLAGTVLDNAGTVVNGSIPLRIRILDALGQERYEFFRATTQGGVRMTVPLAANDPEGEYTVVVEELLSGKTGQATFTYEPASRCGSLAGATRRSFLFGRDYENIYRFFRVHQDVTIVVGDKPEYREVAQRIADYLVPWTVRSTIVDAASVNEGKVITEEMRDTVVGMKYGGQGWTKDFERSKNLGFDIDGPVLLIGTPQDNPLIADIAGFLPVTPSARVVPGAKRGLLAYQRGAIGARQESITLIAYDRAGLDEAAGSLYEIMAGLKPLTPWTLAATHSVIPASHANLVTELSVAWSTPITDHADALAVNEGSITVITHDGSRTLLDATGAIQETTVIGRAQAVEAIKAMSPDRTPNDLAKRIQVPTHLLRQALVNGDLTAAIYVGGLVRIYNAEDQVVAQRQFDFDVTHLAWLNDNSIVVAFSDATVVKLDW